MHSFKGYVRRCAVGCAAVAAVAASAIPSAGAASPTGNPVAGMSWGIYQGSGDGLWPAFEHSGGTTHQLLARMALQPRVRAYGSWIPTSEIRELISSDIAQEQGGNPHKLVWMALFRLWPHEEAANHVPMTAEQQQAYKNWIDAAIRGIGSAPVGIVLEPDFPLTLDSWGPKVRAGLVRYAATQLASLPNATVYIDGGSADWLPVPELVTLLESAGIQHARGVSLGASHRVSTGSEVRYCRLVGLALARDGFPNKHCVIDTSDNGRPWTNKQFYDKYPRGTYNADDPPACTTKTQRICVALGIPPTTDVGNPRWGLPTGVNAMAVKWVDAYIWTGHPWKVNNAHDFDLQHALEAASADPYF